MPKRPVSIRAKLFTRTQIPNSIQDTLDLICSCGFNIESTSHYLVHSPMHNVERKSSRALLKTLNVDF